MSYGTGEALQAAVYQALSADGTLAALVGAAIFDAPQSGSLPSTYVTLGEEDTQDASTQTGRGARHDFTVSVISDATGFATAKAAAAAVSDALTQGTDNAGYSLVVGLWFRQAKVRRVGKGNQRRIDLRFRARTEDN